MSSPAKTNQEQRAEVQVRVREGDYWTFGCPDVTRKPGATSVKPGTCEKADVWICYSITWTVLSLCSRCEGCAQNTKTCGTNKSMLVLHRSDSRPVLNPGLSF